ncbi:NAD(P)-dependent oxidoreductase [Patulibacter sp. SYSU D01012]|uniref:NAD(P)-dependent oxidoreductase n=1 Tax=Patulibacter sp. SYSU D01012 TaxID=2817381 RepID=UPI001B304E31
MLRWRESLERAGRSPSTIGVYLSAVRHLAAELDVDIDRVKAGKVRRGQPRELSDGELGRLLKQPDRRTRIGKRDLAMLLLMADAGLRREEVAALEPRQFEERRRHTSPALRRAVRDSTAMAVRIRGKGGVERIVPLTTAAVEAVEAWLASRPPAATDHVFVTLPRGARTPGPLSANAIYRRVVRHAKAAAVRDDRMTPHASSNTFSKALWSCSSTASFTNGRRSDGAGTAQATLRGGRFRRPRPPEPVGPGGSVRAMSASRPVRIALSRRGYPGVADASLPAGAELRQPEEGQVPDAEGLIALARDCDALVVSTADRVGEELFAAAPDLKVVALVAVGFDAVDLQAAARHGVVVTNTPGVLAETTADTAVALMLMARRGLVAATDAIRGGRWGAFDPQEFLGLDVAGATLGVVGYGEIGQAVARRGAGFGMTVLQHSRTPKPDDGIATAVGLDELLERSDVVSLNVPRTPQTVGLIGARELDLLGPRGTLVNTARGGVVDEDALLAAVREGRIHSAGLDVFAAEPLTDPKHPLLHEPRVVCLPHIGSGSIETRTRMGRMAMRNVAAVLEGEQAPNAVPLPTA